MMAGEALASRTIKALEAVAGLNGRYQGPAIRSAAPYAVVEAGAESDWSHKSGAGREVRLTVTLRDVSERPVRLRGLTEEAQAAVGEIAAGGDGWRIVSLAFLRSRLLPEGDRSWVATLDYRARMLAE
jgi:hypothetical protein